MVHTIKTGIFERSPNFIGEDMACIAVVPPLTHAQVNAVHEKVLVPYKNACIGEAYCHDSGQTVTEINIFVRRPNSPRLVTARMAAQVADVVRGDHGLIELDPEAFPYIQDSAVELFHTSDPESVTP